MRINKKLRYLISITFVAVIICVISIYGINNSKMTADKKLETKSFSINLTDESMVELSDLIVKGKIEKIKDKGVKSSYATASNGEKIKVSIPCITYELEIKDSLKGNKKDKIELVLADTKENSQIKVGKEYLLYLNQNQQDSLDSYSLVSFTQGVYEFDENSNKINLLIDKSKTLEYNQLQEEIKDLIK